MGYSKAYLYDPLPVWLLASASFGILCASALLVWAGFFVARRSIVLVLKSRCPKRGAKVGRKTEVANLGYNEPEDV